MHLVIALVYFSTLAGIFLSKLLHQWNMAIPGGLQDTRLFLWNAWWFHHALSVRHTNPYFTNMLFHPFGTSLLVHDYPLWMNVITHVGQEHGLSMVASSNVWFGLSWILIGFCTYGLAFEVTGESAAGLVAGTFAMTHSYTLARAMQNWGQFNFYGIALFLWLLIRARKRPDAISFALAGAALAWTAACHYYFLIYSILIWLAVAIHDLSPYSVHISRKSSKANWILVLAAAAGLAATAIAVHPGIIHIRGMTISAKTPQNALFLMWVLGLVWMITQLKIDFKKVVPGTTFGYHLLLGATAALFLSPMLWASVKFILAGSYPKQSILWKTHNSGANLLALFFPNPIHALWGPAVSQWYAVRGMNAQEQAASIGWVCLAVVIVSGIWKTSSSARRWLSLALAATVLSMGTHLHIAQYNLWCPLPFFGFRLLPVLGNVRVPERWMAVGAIAWAIVLAFAITKHKRFAFLVLALVLIENWPGIPYASVPPVSPVYERLKNEPPGAVLTIPLYIGDSSIGTGDAINGSFIFPWDHLWAQIWHQKPIVGGYIGRISRRLIDQYKSDPFTRTLLDLEEHKIPAKEPEPAFGEYAVTNLNFRYVLVYPESTDPDALKYVLGSLPLEAVDISGPIQLYRIKDYRSD